ncbi:MAG: D-2-hydroxyacid dehydrogenase [Lachnospiraceae bacterium]|nr:D-2-hydroxyacid dehydrogenase [Lachnospiraceae bacterium]
MKIVILDTITFGEDMDLSPFQKLGEVEMYPTSTTKEAAERVKDADVIIVNKVLMNQETLAGASHVKLIALTATGYNNVDLAYAKSRNIAVANVSGYSTKSVVQHTFALAFYVLEKLSYYDTYVKSGEYCNSPCFTHFAEHFMELEGKTWGIIGLGTIGKEVAKVASAFGCHVIYYSTSGCNSNAEYEQVDLDTLLRESDVVSIHCPLNDATFHLMDAAAFEKMKSHAVLVNVGRGPIVDEAALVEALNKNQIGGAALDVLSVEPMQKENPLLTVQDSRKLLITPHIAWATTEARTRCLQEVYQNIESFFQGKPRNIVG